MKKLGAIIITAALALGLTQCKKNVETISENTFSGMFIEVYADNVSKVIVTPGATTAPVDFTAGDTLYVGNNRQFVGKLVYSGGENGHFSGTIDDSKCSTSDYLHFYFLGNKKPRAKTATTVTVDIIDQTSEFPVISYAHSTEFFDSGDNTYEAHLLNKCGFVKFIVKDENNNGIAKAVKIKGMNNMVTLDFESNYGDNTPQNPYTYGVVDDSEGAIILQSTADDAVKYAILLPQDAVSAATATAAGYGATATSPTLNTFMVPKIKDNDYIYGGINITLAPNGIIDGLISVSPSKKVYFCSGNVQFRASDDTWRFALNQWDYVGADNANISSNYNGWIDLFGWATSGWNNTANDPKATNWQPWATDQTIYDDPTTGVADLFNPTHYGPTWDGTDPGDANHNNVTAGITGTNYDWGLYHTSGIAGVPQITNAGGYVWHACQWQEGCFFGGDANNGGFNQSTLIGKRIKSIGGNYVPLIGFGTVNGVNGLIILPDHWDGTFDLNFSYYNPYVLNTYNESTTPKWSAMEAYGVAFFPAAGYRDGTTVTYAGQRGGYWSSDPAIYNFHGVVMHDDNSALLPDTGHPLRSDAHVMKFFDTGDRYWYDYRNRGFSVRLYHEID